MLTGNWLSERCAEIEAERRVVITDYARQLILQTVIAYYADPHPDWPDKGKGWTDEEINKKILEHLKMLAERVPKSNGNRITYFHVLHYLNSANIMSGWPVPLAAAN